MLQTRTVWSKFTSTMNFREVGSNLPFFMALENYSCAIACVIAWGTGCSTCEQARLVDFESRGMRFTLLSTKCRKS